MTGSAIITSTVGIALMATLVGCVFVIGGQVTLWRRASILLVKGLLDILMTQVKALVGLIFSEVKE